MQITSPHTKQTLRLEGGYTDKSSSNGVHDLQKLRNTDLMLPSPSAIQTVYAIFILLSFSSLALQFSYMSVSARENCKSS